MEQVRFLANDCTPILALSLSRGRKSPPQVSFNLLECTWTRSIMNDDYNTPGSIVSFSVPLRLDLFEFLDFS